MERGVVGAIAESVIELRVGKGRSRKGVGRALSKGRTTEGILFITGLQHARATLDRTIRLIIHKYTRQKSVVMSNNWLLKARPLFARSTLFRECRPHSLSGVPAPLSLGSAGPTLWPRRTVLGSGHRLERNAVGKSNENPRVRQRDIACPVSFDCALLKGNGPVRSLSLCLSLLLLMLMLMLLLLCRFRVQRPLRFYRSVFLVSKVF